MAKQNREFRLTVQGDGNLTYTIASPFTLEFEVTRNSFASANTGNFRIMNLGQTTREAIRKDWFAFSTFRAIELQAGYGGSLTTIFKGNVSSAQSMRDRETIVTNIEAFDAGFALANARVDKSFSEGTPYRKILVETVKTLPGVSVGAVGTLAGSQGSTLRGNAYSDSSANVMNQLVPGCFFVDNCVAHVLSEKEAIDVAIPTINSSTGLLGTPIRQQNKVQLDMLFEPKIRVGQLVEVESTTERNVNGRYKVIGIRHAGTISQSVAGQVITSLDLLSASPWVMVKEGARNG